MHYRRPDFPDVGTSVLATVGQTPLVALERLSAGAAGPRTGEAGVLPPWSQRQRPYRVTHDRGR